MNNNMSDVSKVVVDGKSLNLQNVYRVSRSIKLVELSSDPGVLEKVRSSWQCIENLIQKDTPIYGVTTGVGGMSNIRISKEEAESLQNNLPWAHKTGIGKCIPFEDIRAGMLIRANSLMRGVSGVRIELIERLILFLNEGVTPYVYEHGSIGASGDLVPLAYIAGSISGIDKRYIVDLCGEELDCISALKKLGLSPLRLKAKEGLALMNGTSVMTGIAANVLYKTHDLIALTLGIHSLAFQSLFANNQPLHPFIHENKPHPGQLWVSEQMRVLLKGSLLMADKLNCNFKQQDDELIQDRYSVRCLPQFLAPIIEGIWSINRQIEIEINSTTDNPLVNVEHAVCLHGGNFLGQISTMAMDQLRAYCGLMVKHLDTQIALMVMPSFSKGLPPSLVGNSEVKSNIGLKGLQITANSLMPMLQFYGQPITHFFPTHAEQYNQNINSLGYGSANLARESIKLYEEYLAIGLIFGVQAVDLRTKIMLGHFDARVALSESSLPIYESVYSILEINCDSNRPLIFNDSDQSLEDYVNSLLNDIRFGELLGQSVKDIAHSLREN